jgi:hypothetical protein
MSHRLRALAVNTWSPEDQAAMHRALDPAGIVVEPAHTEVRFADGLMLRYLRSDTPSRMHMGFTMTDLAGATQRLEDDLDVLWHVSGPGVIHFRDVDENPIYLVGTNPDAVPDFYRRDQKLIAATAFVTEVSATSRWWRALGLSVGDESTHVGSVPEDAPHGDTADVFFGNGPVLQLYPAGTGLATVAHLVIGVDDEGALDAAALGLDELGWDFRREQGALNMYSPDGVGVRLSAPA